MLNLLLVIQPQLELQLVPKFELTLQVKVKKHLVELKMLNHQFGSTFKKQVLLHLRHA